MFRHSLLLRLNNGQNDSKHNSFGRFVSALEQISKALANGCIRNCKRSRKFRLFSVGCICQYSEICHSFVLWDPYNSIDPPVLCVIHVVLRIPVNQRHVSKMCDHRATCRQMDIGCQLLTPSSVLVAWLGWKGTAKSERALFSSHPRLDANRSICHHYPWLSWEPDTHPCR